jgi:hypothetical protein
VKVTRFACIYISRDIDLARAIAGRGLEVLVETTLEMIIILMLIAFIIGLIAGVSINRPNVLR